jgi:hypothetical protein
MDAVVHGQSGQTIVGYILVGSNLDMAQSSTRVQIENVKWAIYGLIVVRGWTKYGLILEQNGLIMILDLDDLSVKFLNEYNSWNFVQTFADIILKHLPISFTLIKH